MDCVFCKIASGEIKADFLFEDDAVVAFRDARPIAPEHVLIIPREHIASMNDMREKHQALLGAMLYQGAALAKELNIADGGYKLLIRTGRHGGQEVPHVHLHLIGGAPLTEGIRPINRGL